jgi:hypothetical protein
MNSRLVVAIQWAWRILSPLLYLPEPSTAAIGLLLFMYT